jgi:hypothetical protein
MDTAITIRTVLVANGKAYVQAGAGIVADSVPATEYEETLGKARALLRAAAMVPGTQGQRIGGAQQRSAPEGPISGRGAPPGRAAGSVAGGGGGS